MRRIDDGGAHFESAWADSGQSDLSHDLGDRLFRDLLTGRPQVGGNPGRPVGAVGVRDDGR